MSVTVVVYKLTLARSTASLGYQPCSEDELCVLYCLLLATELPAWLQTFCFNIQMTQ